MNAGTCVPKNRISITVLPHLNEMLEKISQRLNTNKSKLVERALKSYFTKQLEQDAKVLSKIKFTDLPSEDEWMGIQPSWK